MMESKRRLLGSNVCFLIKTRDVHLIIISIFCLSSYYFYEPAFLPDEYAKIVYWFMLALIFAYSFKRLLYNKEQFRFIVPLRLFLLTMSVSMLPAFIFWRQTPDLTLRAMFPHLGFVLYFYLLVCKPDVKSVEKIIWFLAILYILIYLYSLAIAPDVLFGSYAERDIEDTRGIFRLFVPGRGFLFLAFFIALSNYSHFGKSMWGWIALGLFFVIIAHVIRQYILFSALIAGWVIFWNVPIWKKSVFIIVAVVIGGFLYENLTIIQNLIALTEGQVVESDPNENIRITAYKYFFIEYPANIFCSIFGNGVPHVESNYGHYYVEIINGQKKLYMSDVGYAQVFALYGLIGLCLAFLIFWKSFTAKVPNRYGYLQLFMLFVFLSNILSDYFLSNHNIATISITLYLIERVDEKKKKVKSLL